MFMTASLITLVNKKIVFVCTISKPVFCADFKSAFSFLPALLVLEILGILIFEHSVIYPYT